MWPVDPGGATTAVAAALGLVQCLRHQRRPRQARRSARSPCMELIPGLQQRLLAGLVRRTVLQGGGSPSARRPALPPKGAFPGRGREALRRPSAPIGGSALESEELAAGPALPPRRVGALSPAAPLAELPPASERSVFQGLVEGCCCRGFGARRRAPGDGTGWCSPFG